MWDADGQRFGNWGAFVDEMDRIMALKRSSGHEEPNLDEESKARLREVRKELSKGSMFGMVGGTAVGIIGFAVLPRIFKQLQKTQNKNTLLATVLISASVGSFVGSLVYGKNAAQYVGDIFKMGSAPSSGYQSHLHKNEREIIESMDSAYERRAEAIEKALEQKKRQEQRWNH